MGWSLIDFTADLNISYLLRISNNAGVEEGSEARAVRSAVKSISDHPIYSPPMSRSTTI